MISDGWYDTPVTENVVGGAELQGSDLVGNVMTLTLMVGTIPLSLKML